MTDIRFGSVVSVDPENQRVDLVDTVTGVRIKGAIVLSQNGSTDGGGWGVPSVPKPTSEGLAGSLNSSGRSIIAAYLAASSAHRAIVIGFGAPNGHTISFTQQDRLIEYHPASGAYFTISPDGSIELYHPSGSYFRIGTGPHENLDALAKRFRTVSNAPAPTITLATKSFSFQVTPDGAVAMNAKSWTGTGPVSWNGSWNVTGGINTTEDVVAGSISLQKHVHGGVKGGDSTTSAPE